MFCEKCGSEMLDTAKFCPSCGEKNDQAEEQLTENIVPKEETVQEEVDTVVEEPTPEPEGPVVSTVVEKETKSKKTVKQAAPPKPQFVNGKDLTKPLSTASYFFMFFLLAIPIIRLTMLLVWSFSDNVNVNKKHFAHAVFIWVLVSLILAIVATIVMFIVFGSTFYEMFIIW